MVDTNGRALTLQVYPADIQDRDRAMLLRTASGRASRSSPSWSQRRLIRRQVSQTQSALPSGSLAKPWDRLAFKSTRDAGSSNVASPGSSAIECWQRTSRQAWPSVTAFLYAASAMMQITQLEHFRWRIQLLERTAVAGLTG